MKRPTYTVRSEFCDATLGDAAFTGTNKAEALRIARDVAAIACAGITARILVERDDITIHAIEVR